MADYTKTQGTVILSHQEVTHPNTVKGAAQDVSSKISATLFLFHAITEDTGNTNPGVFLVQVSGSSSGDEDWATIHSFPVNNSNPDTVGMNASEPSGETVLAVSSTTGFIAGDILYIQDAGVVADGEWAKCQEVVTNTSINLIDGLANAKDSSDIIWNDANVFVVQVDLSSIGRLRIVFQHEGNTGADCHVKALMVTADSFA